MDKLKKSMSNLIELLEEVTTQALDEKDYDKIDEWLETTSKITTNIKTLSAIGVPFAQNEENEVSD